MTKSILIESSIFLNVSLEFDSDEVQTRLLEGILVCVSELNQTCNKMFIPQSGKRYCQHTVAERHVGSAHEVANL